MNAKWIIRGVAFVWILVFSGLVGLTLAAETPALPNPVILNPDTGFGRSMAFHWMSLGPPLGRAKPEQPIPNFPTKPNPNGPCANDAVGSKVAGIIGSALKIGGGTPFHPWGKRTPREPDPAPVMKELASVRAFLGL